MRFSRGNKKKNEWKKKGKKKERTKCNFFQILKLAKNLSLYATHKSWKKKSAETNRKNKRKKEIKKKRKRNKALGLPIVRRVARPVSKLRDLLLPQSSCLPQRGFPVHVKKQHPNRSSAWARNGNQVQHSLGKLAFTIQICFRQTQNEWDTRNGYVACQLVQSIRNQLPCRSNHIYNSKRPHLSVDFLDHDRRQQLGRPITTGRRVYAKRTHRKQERHPWCSGSPRMCFLLLQVPNDWVPSFRKLLHAVTNWGRSSGIHNPTLIN